MPGDDVIARVVGAAKAEMGSVERSTPDAP
jgi:hypothetical protein